MPARYVELDLTQLREMYEDGWTIPEIAQAFDCAVGTVWRRLKAMGVVRRNRGQQVDRSRAVVEAGR